MMSELAQSTDSEFMDSDLTELLELGRESLTSSSFLAKQDFWDFLNVGSLQCMMLADCQWDHMAEYLSNTTGSSQLYVDSFALLGQKIFNSFILFWQNESQMLKCGYIAVFGVHVANCQWVQISEYWNSCNMVFIFYIMRYMLTALFTSQMILFVRLPSDWWYSTLCL